MHEALPSAEQSHALIEAGGKEVLVVGRAVEQDNIGHNMLPYLHKPFGFSRDRSHRLPIVSLLSWESRTGTARISNSRRFAPCLRDFVPIDTQVSYAYFPDCYKGFPVSGSTVLPFNDKPSAINKVSNTSRFSPSSSCSARKLAYSRSCGVDQ